MALISGCLIVVCACALVLLGALTGRRGFALEMPPASEFGPLPQYSTSPPLRLAEDARD